MAKKVLVFDIGAEIARTVLCTFDDGRFTLEDLLSVPNKPIAENGRTCWDVDEIYEQMKIGISFGVFNGGFDAICIESCGADFGLIDRDGALLSAPVNFSDSRTRGLSAEIAAKIPAEELYERTGVLLRDTNTTVQLHYLATRQSNELFRVEKLLMMPDLFAYLLTGECRSEYTAATTSQLIDCRAKGWDIHLIERLGLPKRMFCPLIHAGETYGMLKDELAEEYRCEPVPVIACPSHETAAAELAVPCTDEHFAFICCGSSAHIGTETKRPLNTRAALEAGFTNGGAGSGRNMLLRTVTGLRLVEECRRSWAERGLEYSLEELETMARGEETFASFIDPDSADFAAAEDMPSAVAEYCRRTGQPVPTREGEVLRCIYRSLACEFALAVAQTEQLTGLSFPRIHMTGVKRGSLLCELTATACGRTVVAGQEDASVLGCALSTLIALGEIENIAQARETIASDELTEVFEPDNTAHRENALRKFREITGR